jgi:hypothetical protein
MVYESLAPLNYNKMKPYKVMVRFVVKPGFFVLDWYFNSLVILAVKLWYGLLYNYNFNSIYNFNINFGLNLVLFKSAAYAFNFLHLCDLNHPKKQITLCDLS